MARKRLTRKAREWVVRYAPAEIIGTIAAVGAATLMHGVSESLVASAIAATISENVGFYGYFIVREVGAYYKRHHQHAHLRRIGLAAMKAIRGMAVEFGPAELLDSFLVRPFCIYAGSTVFSNFTIGIMAGKIFADVLFYACTISCYELRKRWLDVPSKPHMSEYVPEQL